MTQITNSNPRNSACLKRQKHLFLGFVTVYQCLFIATQKLYIIRDVFKAVNMSHRHEINCKINLADVKLSIWITSLPYVLYFDISLMFIPRIAFSAIHQDMQCLNLKECNSLKCNIWEMLILEFEILIQLQALSISNF